MLSNIINWNKNRKITNYLRHISNNTTAYSTQINFKKFTNVIHIYIGSKTYQLYPRDYRSFEAAKAKVLTILSKTHGRIVKEWV